MHLNSALFCFVVAIILLIFSTFMEGTAIAVLLVPVLWPIAQSMGIDVIHFGMIVCISNVVDAVTPPVAVNIFSASTVSGTKWAILQKQRYHSSLDMWLYSSAAYSLKPSVRF